MVKFTREFTTSLITVIVAIFAIAIFIDSGSSLLFYVAIVIALAFGVYNTWLIASLETEEQTKKSTRKR